MTAWSDRAETLLAEATPGPWYAFHVDDHHAMNCYGVSDDPHFERDEDYLSYGVGPNEPCRRIVAMTLYQAQRIVSHADGKWEGNAHLIAASRDLVPLLVNVAKAAEAVREHDDNDPAPLRSRLEAMYEALTALRAWGNDA